VNFAINNRDNQIDNRRYNKEASKINNMPFLRNNDDDDDNAAS